MRAGGPGPDVAYYMSPFRQLTPRPTRWGSTGSAAGRRKSPSSVHEQTGFVCVKHEPCRDCCFPTASPRSALKETLREDLSDGLYLKEMRERRRRRSRERERQTYTCWKHLKIIKCYWKVRSPSGLYMQRYCCSVRTVGRALGFQPGYPFYAERNSVEQGYT